MRKGLAPGHTDLNPCQTDLKLVCLTAGYAIPTAQHTLLPLTFLTHCQCPLPWTVCPGQSPCHSPWTLQTLSVPHLALTLEAGGIAGCVPPCLALSPTAWGSLGVGPGAKVTLSPSIAQHGARPNTHHGSPQNESMTQT